MKGTTILLLGAATLVAYASAHPYSKIPEVAPLPDGYNYKKSSSNSNSNSYSQSNQDNADIHGAYGGQSFSGSKSSGYSTSGGSHSQSSSFASSSVNGKVPLSIFGGPGIPASPDQPSGYVQPSLAFGNPGTAGLGLSNGASGFSTGSFSSSYGNSNAGGNAGSSNDQVTEGVQGSGSSGSYIGSGIGSIGSGLNSGVNGGSSGSNSGVYGSSDGLSFEQAGIPIAGSGIGSINSGLNTGHGDGSSGSNSGIYGSTDGILVGQSGFPISGSYGTLGSGYFGQAGSQPGSVQYWWNGPNSPFGLDGKPSGGCSSNACTLSGSFDLNQGSTGGAHASNQDGQVGLNINGGNPFLGGHAGSGSGHISSGSSFGQSAIGFGSGSGSGTGSGAGSGSGLNIQPIDGSKNPFLNGGYVSSSGGSGFAGGSGSFASSNSASGAASSGSGSHGSSGSSGSFNGAGNPFLKPGSGPAQKPQGFGHIPQGFGQTPQGFGQTPQGFGQTPQGFGQTPQGFSQTPQGFGKTPQGSGQLPTTAPGHTASQGSVSVNTGAGSHNPFFKPGSGSVVITPPIPVFPTQSNQGFPSSSPLPGSGSFTPQQSVGDNSTPKITSGPGVSTPSYHGSSGSFGSAGTGDFQSQTSHDSSFSSQSTIGSGSSSAGYPTISPLIPEQEPSKIDGGLTVSCSGQGRICVLKNLCVNGRVISNGQGLMQVRTGTQLCNVDREVCCTLNASPGASTNFGNDQGVNFASSGSSSHLDSGSAGNFGSFSGSSGKPTQPAPTGSYGQSTGSTGNYGQSTGSTGNYGQSTSSSGSHGQSGHFSSSGSYGQSGQFGNHDKSGSSGNFDQTAQSGSAGSYNQAQQKETFNFGDQSNVHASSGSGTTFGNQGASGYTPGFPSGSSLGTPAPNLIHVTPGTAFVKPTGSRFNANAGNSGFASASANAYAGASGQAGSGASGSHIDSSSAQSATFSNIKKPGNVNGGLFGSSDNSGEDLSAGDISYTGTLTGIKESSTSNGYLPPIGGEPSANVPAFSEPPRKGGRPNDRVPIVKRPPPRQPEFPPVQVTIPVGCAAALICVEERFCTLEGVISPQPVALTSQQIERRAPLSSCKNPDNGVIGKCCRDPNYVDPWPTGNLPANYSGGFDEQGFPTYLNYAKTHPTKKQPPTKTGFHQSIKNVGVTPNTPGKAGFGDFFTGFLDNFTQRPTTGAPEIGETSESDNNVVQQSDSTDENQVTQKPSTTNGQNIFDLISNRPTFPTFPTLPPFTFPTISIPNFFNNGQKNFDQASTNENPSIIASHTPGAQCGLRNKVQRPSGLDIDDVAFGEIPWQAMILSTRDRKLLCSGAIVAPNAVLTAAHCVTGLRPEHVSIKSGEWKLGYEIKQEEPLPFEIVKVANIVSHPGFQPNSPSHNIAILFLEHPVALDQHVDVICLGDIPQPKLGRKCISTGWGKVVLQANVAGSLMHGINVDIVPQDSCKQRLQGAESQLEIDNTLTCVKPENQRNNMCQVDAGGPLACDRGDGNYELTGVYSQDTGCQPTNQVATFALIDTNWVKQNLANPPPVQRPSIEIEVPASETQTSSSTQTHYGSHVNQPGAPCDCQKSYLPPKLNQYLPPV